MDNDFEIEVEQTQEKETSVDMQLPLNFLTLGEVENDDVKVYIRQSTYKELEKLAASDTSKELGSILFGEYTEQLGKTHVVISDFVEAKYTDASAATLTFTHETWDYVHKEHAKRFPEKKIIGWQHTHPNYGIFLSNYDMFIQENFFNMPFQVAYVIDPIQNLRGFFQWKNGRIEKLKGYYIYDEVGKPIKIEQSKPKQEDGKAAKGLRAAKVAISLLCVLCVVLAVCLFASRKNFKEEQKVLEQQVQQKEAAAQEAYSQLNDSEMYVQELVGKLEDSELTVKNQEAVIKELQGIDGDRQITLVTYTVKQNDNLCTICEANGIDYYANQKLILALNDMENADMLWVGQELLLPVLD